MEAYIDSKVLGIVPDPLDFKPIDIDLLTKARTATLVFLPTQLKESRKHLPC